MSAKYGNKSIVGPEATLALLEQPRALNRKRFALIALLVFTNVIDRLLFALRSAVWTPVMQFFSMIVFGRGF